MIDPDLKRALGQMYVGDYLTDVDGLPVYSSRKGWRIADTPARKPGESVRDKLLQMVEERG